jgi:hypothetical protein
MFHLIFFYFVSFKKNTVISDMLNMLIKFVIVIQMDMRSLKDLEHKNFQLIIISIN